MENLEKTMCNSTQKNEKMDCLCLLLEILHKELFEKFIGMMKKTVICKNRLTGTKIMNTIKTVRHRSLALYTICVKQIHSRLHPLCE